MSKCLETIKVNSLEQLREKRWNWVEASRDNNFEGGIKQLLTDLYPDNAHFIYELLQNAEDPHATVVRFTLSDSSVEFEHDGERLFSLEDICSITSIGASTKRDDPTSIGKFGVGFKAVFAYTNTPEIHSGEFHFCIHDLVVPETEGVSCPKMDERETRFVFVFDNPKKSRKQAAEEIERGLRALGDNTLLFLNHIRKIEYLLPDSSLGSLERIPLTGGRIEIRACQPGKKVAASHWLRFEEDVEVTDEDGTIKTCHIAIAYRLAKEEDKKGGDAWKIVPLDHGQVSIYFPAEKEASNLRFHIHAPFASTVARDSVRDCVANNTLRDHLAQLVAESLISIRDQKLLTVDFLAVLPNPDDKLSAFYEPIRKAIVNEFRTKPLVPARTGGYEAAIDLIRCPARLANALSDDDLAIITGCPQRVSANPPKINPREDRFLRSLGITDWGWKELSAALSLEERREAIEVWIGGKDNQALGEWYGLLNELKKQVSYPGLGKLRMVRASTALGTDMYRPSEAFFLRDTTSARPNDIPFVESVFCSGDSKDLLESIGVQPYDEKAVVIRILNTYGSSDASLDRDKVDEHVAHIRMFILFLKYNPNEACLFEGHKLLLGQTREDRIAFFQPSNLYLDNPYSETLLSAYFERLEATKCARHKIASIYEDEGVNPEDLGVFAKGAGVSSALDVHKLNNVDDNPDRDMLKSGGEHVGGGWDNYKRIQIDFDIHELDILIQSIDTDSSRLIWKTMSDSVRPDHLKATYQRNARSGKKNAPSLLVHRLRSANWIPQYNGRFVKPSEAKASELPSGFAFDSGWEWLKAIGFGDEEKKRSEEYQALDRMAHRMDLSSGDELAAYLDAIKDSGLTPEQIRAAGLQKKQVSQPEEAVKDPEKRRRGVREGKDTAPPNESVARERAIQPGVTEVTAEAKAYLRAKYKNAEEQLICQCCHEEMPFKLPSGDHYFEAVQCVRGLDAHHHQNRLALCPTCAAMYQYARETEDAELRRRIVDHPAVEQSPSVEIPVRLAGREHTLYFVGTHWFDLKTVLGGDEAI